MATALYVAQLGSNYRGSIYYLLVVFSSADTKTAIYSVVLYLSSKISAKEDASKMPFVDVIFLSSATELRKSEESR